MGKVFITDEVNDNYTADVTHAGKLEVEDGASTYVRFATAAQSDISAHTAASGGVYLKSIIIGQHPQTAASLTIYNTIDSASEACAWSDSGEQVIATLVWDVGAACAAACGLSNLVPESGYPKTIPFNVYCASGISLGVSLTAATTSPVYLGCVENITVVYQG